MESDVASGDYKQPWNKVWLILWGMVTYLFKQKKYYKEISAPTDIFFEESVHFLSGKKQVNANA